jgi:hypothetical protein
MALYRHVTNKEDLVDGAAGLGTRPAVTAARDRGLHLARAGRCSVRARQARTLAPLQRRHPQVLASADVVRWGHVPHMQRGGRRQLGSAHPWHHRRGGRGVDRVARGLRMSRLGQDLPVLAWVFTQSPLLPSPAHAHATRRVTGRREVDGSVGTLRYFSHPSAAVHGSRSRSGAEKVGMTSNSWIMCKPRRATPRSHWPPSRRNHLMPRRGTPWWIQHQRREPDVQLPHRFPHLVAE